jgi:hypothetical protein
MPIQASYHQIICWIMIKRYCYCCDKRIQFSRQHLFLVENSYVTTHTDLLAMLN